MKKFYKLLLCAIAVLTALPASADINLWIRSAAESAPYIVVQQAGNDWQYVKRDGTTTDYRYQACFQLTTATSNTYPPNGNDDDRPTKWWFVSIPSTNTNNIASTGITFELSRNAVPDNGTLQSVYENCTNSIFESYEMNIRDDNVRNPLKDGKTYYFIYDNGDPTFYLDVTPVRSATSYVFFQQQGSSENTVDWREDTRYRINATLTHVPLNTGYITGKFGKLLGSQSEEMLYRCGEYGSPSSGASENTKYKKIYLLFSDEENTTDKVSFYGRSGASDWRRIAQQYFEADYVKGGFYEPTSLINVTQVQTSDNQISYDIAGTGRITTDAFQNIEFPDNVEALKVNIAGSESSTSKNQNYDHYVNYLTLADHSSVLASHLIGEANGVIKFKRRAKQFIKEDTYSYWSTLYNSQLTTFATVTIGSHTIDEGTGKVTIHYTVTYENQADATLIPTTRGTFTAESVDSPVDFSSLEIIDQFNSPNIDTYDFGSFNAYFYYVSLEPFGNPLVVQETMLELKNATAKFMSYHVETGATVWATPVPNPDNGLNNTTIVEIDPVFTDEDYLNWHNTTGGVSKIELFKNDDVVAKLEQNTTNPEKFDIYAIDENQQLTATGAQTSLYDLDRGTLLMELPDVTFSTTDTERMIIYAKTKDHKTGAYTKESTFSIYISPSSVTPESFGFEFKIENETPIKSQEAADKDGNIAYSLKLTMSNNYSGIEALAQNYITGDPDEGNAYEATIFTFQYGAPVLYRLWRVENPGETNEKWTFLNNATDLTFTPTGSQGEVSSNYTQLDQNYDDSAGKWTVPESITVWDHMLDKPLAQLPNQSKHVRYIVRLYLPEKDIIWRAPRKEPRAYGNPYTRFAVFERQLDIELDDHQIITAVDGTSITKVPVKVSYTNPAGQTGDTPFSGVNIVTTHYTDGTTSVTKEMK